MIAYNQQGAFHVSQSKEQKRRRSMKKRPLGPSQWHKTHEEASLVADPENDQNLVAVGTTKSMQPKVPENRQVEDVYIPASPLRKNSGTTSVYLTLESQRKD